MMLFPCFTVFKSLHELTGDLQRKSAESSWGFTHFRVPTDRNDFYLNPECHPKCGCPDRKPTASRNIELASGVLPAADCRHSMAASEFEYRHRFWMIVLVYVTAYAFYNLHLNSFNINQL